MVTRILFVGARGTRRGPLARALLLDLAGSSVEVHCASAIAGRGGAELVEVLQEIGLGLDDPSSPALAEVEQGGFDLVITLGKYAGDYCHKLLEVTGGKAGEEDLAAARPLLIGAPVMLSWGSVSRREAVVEERTPDQVAGALREIRDDLAHRVRDLVEHGYLAALVGQRRRMLGLLDSLEDGIIAHDSKRRLYLFNTAAERITGWSREEVLGRDCRQVFCPDGLCGAMCNFKHQDPERLENDEYEVAFTNRQGDLRRIKMAVTEVELEPGMPGGVTAAIRDVTEVNELRWKLSERHSLHGMVGVSEPMQEVFETIRQVAPSDYSVLVTGDSGTGKELVARAIHAEGRRKGGPFVPINCGALPENVLESELFGHVRGAFTGAIRDKKGRFELADGGTLFLDEVGELTPAFQVKLLRVLQEQRFERVGGEKTIEVDVRVVSATNRDLRKMVEEGTFREDLFYRLCVVPLSLPPLRERREDMPELVSAVMERIRGESGKEIHRISDGAMERLLGWTWPGNVRELINALQFATVRCEGDEIQERHLPPEVRQPQTALVTLPGQTSSAPSAPPPRAPKGLKLDRERVRQALDATGGNKVQAAKLLGVGRATLYRFLRDNPVP